VFEPELEAVEIHKLRSLQEEKMLGQIGYAYENVPFYRNKFEEVSIVPDDIKNIEDVAKIPFTVKGDLEILDYNRLPRAEGKSKRIIDLRKKQG
jgi:phenylacetate-CoA ligase